MLMTTKENNGILVVHLRGELDHHAVETMRQEIETEILQTRYQALVMSCGNIDFMDSSGLGLILGRFRTMTDQGGKMVLCEVSPALRRLFEMSGLLKVLPVYASEEDAVRAVKGE